jgi:hypothetical protein
MSQHQLRLKHGVVEAVVHLVILQLPLLVVQPLLQLMSLVEQHINYLLVVVVLLVVAEQVVRVEQHQDFS